MVKSHDQDGTKSQSVAYEYALIFLLDDRRLANGDSTGAAVIVVAKIRELDRNRVHTQFWHESMKKHALAGHCLTSTRGQLTNRPNFLAIDPKDDGRGKTRKLYRQRIR